MNESKFLETLVERYLNNQATDRELEVFMDLLRQGRLDDLIRERMDREEEQNNPEKPECSTVRSFHSQLQWLQIAASVVLILF